VKRQAETAKLRPGYQEVQSRDGTRATPKSHAPIFAWRKPVVGFDRAGYRLGYGGGFFDRRLASFPHRPFAIGVGYDAAAIRTIYPLPHDVPMEAIVTERNFQANERVQTGA
jgi:5,10-methenyltetrahydrofolate synthetase